MILLADAHVHLHDVFSIPYVLSSAYGHFLREAKRHSCDTSFTGMLLLSESDGQDWFGKLKNHGIPPPVRSPGKETEGWTVGETPERCSILIENGLGHRLFILAGRQIVTRERIEILSLASTAHFRDGMSFEETYDSVAADGAIPVLPWGFGKWLGRRGAIIGRFLETCREGIVFLGDNGGRPRLIPFPTEICRSRPNLLIRVLPGSDPLPFPWESDKAGGFGFSVRGTVDPEHPASDLKKILHSRETFLQPYGSPESFSRFLRNQVGMQMRKRAKGARREET